MEVNRSFERWFSSKKAHTPLPFSSGTLPTSVGDLNPDPDPTPDPTPFFSGFNDDKKLFFSFFLLELTGTLSSVLKFNFLLTFFVKILFCKHYFSLLSTFMRVEGPEPDPHL
jgi:hypothetical protein